MASSRPEPSLARRYHLRSDRGRVAITAGCHDLFSRKIVGWEIQAHMQVELASAAITMAITLQRPLAGLIHHSDRSVKYAARAYRNALTAAGISHR